MERDHMMGGRAAPPGHPLRRVPAVAAPVSARGGASSPLSGGPVATDPAAAVPASAPSSSWRIRHGAHIILAVTVIIEAALLIGLVRPLWLFGPHEAIISPEPLATLLGIRTAGMERFAATITVWLAGFTVVFVLSRGPLSHTARRLLYAAPLVFAGTLLLVLPVSSKDVYHYVMEGRLLAVHGANPMVVPPAAYADDKLGWIVSSWQETPSRYGPVFNLLAGAVAAAGHGNLTATVLGFKVLAAGSLLGSAWLAWATVRRARPEAAPAAWALIAWNPLALYEAGANAHNDLLMVFFTALALYLASRARWERAFPALALGALTKYIVVLLGPLFLIEAIMAPRRSPAASVETGRWGSDDLPPFHAGVVANAQPPGRGSGISGARALPWTRGRVRASVPASAVAGIGAAAALCALLYLPFWDGRQTFDALRSASGDMLSSPGWLLREALKHRFGWDGARPVTTAMLTVAFVAGYVLLLARAWRRGRQRLRTPGIDGRAASGSRRRVGFTGGDVPVDGDTASALPSAAGGAEHARIVRLAGYAFAVLALELCTLSWWFWPWYVLWLLPPAALLSSRRLGLLMWVISSAALVSYVPINFRELFWGLVPTDAMSYAVALTVFLPPLLAAVLLAGTTRRAAPDA